MCVVLQLLDPYMALAGDSQLAMLDSQPSVLGSPEGSVFEAEGSTQADSLQSPTQQQVKHASDTSLVHLLSGALTLLPHLSPFWGQAFVTLRPARCCVINECCNASCW